MERIKSLPADQQLIKIKEFKIKYNISSEQLKSQTGYDTSTKGKDKNNITELNELQGKGKINKQQEGLLNSRYLKPQSSIKPYRALPVERIMSDKNKINYFISKL